MSVGEMLAATVPMARTLQLEFLETYLAIEQTRSITSCTSFLIWAYCRFRSSVGIGAPVAAWWVVAGLLTFLKFYYVPNIA